MPAQLRSAWRLEGLRLGDADMALFDRRQLRNRVLHGKLAEWAAAFAILGGLGAGAFAFLLLQASLAVLLLEAVNYFGHWGLRRRGRKPLPSDSWDTESAFTLYTLVGLSRHADHHAFATRPYRSSATGRRAPSSPPATSAWW